MKNTRKNKDKGIKRFNTIYMAGVAFAILKLVDYFHWTFQLVKRWSLPEEPFFSQVNLVNSNVDISITAYLIFAVAYIITFGFIILGLYQLHNTTKLFAQRNIFQEQVGSAFRKAGKSFLVFAYGTFTIDLALLAWANTSNRVIDLLSTELVVFVISGYLMFFLADIFKEGISIREGNELTA